MSDVTEPIAAAKAEYWRRAAEIDAARAWDPAAVHRLYLDMCAVITERSLDVDDPAFERLVDRLLAAEAARSMGEVRCVMADFDRWRRGGSFHALVRERLEPEEEEEGATGEPRSNLKSDFRKGLTDSAAEGSASPGRDVRFTPLPMPKGRSRSGEDLGRRDDEEAPRLPLTGLFR